MKSQKIVSLNPSLNYEVIGEIDSSTNHEIDVKIANARKAQQKWSELSVNERVLFLKKLYQAFVTKKNDICSIIAQEVGMPISTCENIEFVLGLSYLKGYLEYAEQWLAPEITYETAEEKHILF